MAGATGIVDELGNLGDTAAGLAVLKVHYSADKAHGISAENGILVVVCDIAGPPAVIEGTTATKGVVDYSNPLIPTVTTGNTLFHILHD